MSGCGYIRFWIIEQFYRIFKYVFGTISTHLKDLSTFIDICIIDDDNKLLDFGQLMVPFLFAHDLINITYDIKIKRRTNKIVMKKIFNILISRNFFLKLMN